MLFVSNAWKSWADIVKSPIISEDHAAVVFTSNRRATNCPLADGSAKPLVH
ncbi:hypothetical protein [Cellulosimicrobium sp. NPDC057127]|uniref:hypothetical protein n=1 Tax=Cellulosimicrobium sp. NPDC057127 TaxID=3346026 RepID=UPI003629D4DA